MRFARVKRVAAFLLLLTAGFFLLELARGGGELFPVRPSTETVGISSRPGDQLGGDSEQVNISGKFQAYEEKEVAGPGGIVHLFRTSEMVARDSKPLPGNRQEILDGTLSFYQVRLGTNAEPHNEKTAEMTVGRMVMHRAPGKTPKPAPDKDLELQDAVLTSLAGGAAGGIVLRIKRGLARPGPDGLRFRTEGELDPFELTIGAGDAAHRLIGKGLSGSVPGAGAPATGGIEIDIHKDVRIEPLGAGPTRMTGGCGGPMTYRSLLGDHDSGVLVLAGGVELEVSGAAADGMRVKGERLSTLLERSAPRAGGATPGDGKLALLAGELSGEQVELEAQGSVVRGRRLSFACGPGGQLERMRVTGQPRLRVPSGQLSAGEPVWIHAATAIEIVTLPPLTAFGLAGAPTRWTCFEGETRTEGSSETGIRADSGLLVATGASGGDLALHARGHSRIEMSGTWVEGDGGLTLHRSEDGAVSVHVNRGFPAAAFSAERPGTGVLRGRGFLDLDRDAAGGTTLELDDPEGTSLVADLGAGRTLSGAAHMTIVSDSSRQTLDARGTSLWFVDPTQGVRVEDARSIVAENGTIAIRGRSTAPAGANGGDAVPYRRARLIHSPLGREPDILTAYCIDLLPTGTGKPTVLARDDVRIEINGVAVDTGSTGTVVLTCDRFVSLPALLPEGDAAFAFLPAGAPWSRALSADLGPTGPGWARADGNVTLTLRGADGGTQVFRCATVVARMDVELVVLQGSGATFEIERPGSSLVWGSADYVVKDGERLVLGGGPNGGGCTLWMKGKGDLLSVRRPGEHAVPVDADYQSVQEARGPREREAEGEGEGDVTTRIDCANPVEITKDRILTTGRTLVTTADENFGDPLPDGLVLRSMGLDVTLADGEFTRVLAAGPVTIRRATLSGKGESLVFDPRTGDLTLAAGADLAEIAVEAMLHLTSSEPLRFNVLTYGWDVVRGTLR